MNKDKQIEEITAELIKTNSYGTLNAVASHLYNAGYRKASDVAREIFEEIEEVLNMQAKIVCQTRQTVMKADSPALSYMAMLDGRIYSLRVVEEHIDELKKKYTEGER